MAYLLEAETEGNSVYLVGFSLEKVTYKPPKIKFLSGLGYAIFIAACGFDENTEADTMSFELDTKAFLPKKMSIENIASESAAMGAWSKRPSDLNLAGEECVKGLVSITNMSQTSNKSSESFEQLYLPPTWDPIHPFSFPVASMPIACPAPDDLTLHHFTDIRHVADGSNSNVFLATFQNEKVIIFNI